MNIKVIGFLLISLFESREILGDAPVTRVFTEIASSNANDSINQLGTHYREKLLRASKGTIADTFETSLSPLFFYLGRDDEGLLGRTWIELRWTETMCSCT